MLAVNGIHPAGEHAAGGVAANRVHEFAFVMQPLKRQGFSGASVAPIAIR